MALTLSSAIAGTAPTHTFQRRNPGSQYNQHCWSG